MTMATDDGRVTPAILSALELNGLKALLDYAAGLRHGAPGIGEETRSTLAIVALQGGVAIDAVAARGRLLDALDDALEALDRGWTTFVETALSIGRPDPALAGRAGSAAGRLIDAPRDHRSLVAALDDEGRDAYRAVVTATPVPRMRDEAEAAPHLPLVSRVRAGGGAAVAYGLGRLTLGRALAGFGRLSETDWATAQMHVRAERAAVGGLASSRG